MPQTAGKPPSASSAGARSGLLGTGMFVPERVVPNAWFEGRLDTNDEWIRTRTGIKERRFAEPQTRTSELATAAARMALKNSGLTGDDIGLVVVATTVPDMHMPSTANFVVRDLELKKAFAYDVSAACSGFLFALAGADAQLRAGLARHALVIGAELYSSIIDLEDRGTCVLFGDGAGAVVWGAPVDGAGGRILQTHLASQGEYADILDCRGGGTAFRAEAVRADPKLDCVRMDGPMVFRLAVQGCCESIRQVLAAQKLAPTDISRIIPHQANYRIVDKIAREFDYPMERIEVNLDRYGNTAAASVPIALHEAVAAGRIRPGDLVLLVAAGAGFNSGAILMKV